MGTPVNQKYALLHKNNIKSDFFPISSLFFTFFGQNALFMFFFAKSYV